MAGTAALLFIWLRRVSGPTAAWLGAGLFAISPFAVESAQYVRFYSLQAFLFLAGALLAAGLPISARWPTRFLQVVAGGTCLAFAVWLNPTALIGTVGLGVWLLGALLLPWLHDPTVPRSGRFGALTALILLGIAALAVAFEYDVAERLLERYSEAPAFNEENVNRFYFYHVWYVLYYPTLWPATGVLAVAALTSRPRPASLAVVVFGTAFLLSSFAASKGVRYLVYAQAFLFAIWGLGLAALLPALSGWLRGARRSLKEAMRSIGGAFLAKGLLAGVLLFLVLANPAWLRSI
jgi:hypothetical protein